MPRPGRAARLANVCSQPSKERGGAAAKLGVLRDDTPCAVDPVWKVAAGGFAGGRSAYQGAPTDHWGMVRGHRRLRIRLLG